MCVRGGKGEAEGLEPGDVVEGVEEEEEAANRKGGSGPKSMTQQNGVGYHESSEWGEAGTADNQQTISHSEVFSPMREILLFHKRRLAWTSPAGMASSVLLGLGTWACRGVRENLSQLTSQKSVS